jgi:imidazolonepropionase
MRILIKNIKKLVQTEKSAHVDKRSGLEMSNVECIENAWLSVRNGKIESFGRMLQFPETEGQADIVIDASERFVFPSFCDCHTHLVYAGSREVEFFDKIRGLTYLEIAARGGGILNSADLLRNTPSEVLFESAMERMAEIAAKGTGAVEIKSGYGLSPEEELRILRVIKRVADASYLTVKATLLGAHAIPRDYKDNPSGFADLVINEMIPVAASEGLAEYADVFCEKGFFSMEDSDRILNAAVKYGLRPRVHANQMSDSGGVQVAVKYNAISADHLEFAKDEEINLLKHSDTMPVLLPGSTFFLGMDYPRTREMIDRGLPVAIASNYNPGSSPSGDMRFMMFLAALNMKMNVNELINASTVNGAYAMDISDTHGTIAPGKEANLFITKPMSSEEFFIYSYTTPLIEKVILKGKIQ